MLGYACRNNKWMLENKNLSLSMSKNMLITLNFIKIAKRSPPDFLASDGRMLCPQNTSLWGRISIYMILPLLFQKFPQASSHVMGLIGVRELVNSNTFKGGVNKGKD